MRVTRDEAIAATQARVLAGEGLPPRFEFSTDTRSLAPGDVFVALHGERFDGHDFVGEAIARGAAACIVECERVVPEGTPALVVDNAMHAYLALGGVARRHSRASVVAVTGSAGKTTTKALLAQILERTQSGRVLATPANENNEIGVAKLLLGMPDDTAYLVVEFGARHFGEIETLARAARPDVGVITNIGEAHLGIIGSPERLVETKWGIFATGARPVLDRADASLRARIALGRSKPAMWFDVRESEPAPLTGIGERELVLVGRERLDLHAAGSQTQRCPARIDLPGDHNRRNVAAAAAAAVELGIELETVAGALAGLALPKGRYERIPLGDFDVIYDAYNASMSGTIATLGSFAREAGARRIAVLGSMAELGDDAARMHVRVGEAAAKTKLEALLVGGEFADDLAAGARAGGLEPSRIVPFERNAEATAWLRAHVRAGDLILLKASRRYKLEEILDELRATHA